jgi:hypothetical protein
VSKEFIQDSFVFEASKYESISSNKKGVLRTLKGPLAEYELLNRNNRKYAEKLWDNVLESDYVKEQTQYKTLFGEANHPTGRYEIDFERVSHSIVEMHKVPEKKQIWGTIDILDTPLGNVLNVLCEYGSTLGFSSRAGGVLNKKKDYVEVDVDSFHFITFDAVPFPSVKAARLVSEGTNNLSMDKFELSEEAHGKICGIIESCATKDKETLKQFIYSLEDYNLDREISVLEGISEVKGKSANDSMKDTTLCLLKESYLTSSKLRNENEVMKGKVSVLEGKSEELQKKAELLEGSVEGLKDSLLKTVNEKAQYKVQIDTLTGELSKLRNTIVLNEEKALDVEMSSFEVRKIEEENRVLKSMVVERDSKVSVLEGKILELNSTRIDESKYIDYDEVYEELGKVMKELSELRPKYENLVSESSKFESQYLLCLEGNKELTSSNKMLKESVAGLTSEKAELIHANNDLNDIVEGLNVEKKNLEVSIVEGEEISKNTYSTELKKIEEGYKGEISELRSKFSKDVNTYKHGMINAVCGIYGVNESAVVGKLGKNFSLGDLHIICEEVSSNFSVSSISVEEEVDCEAKIEVDESVAYKKRLGDVVGGSRRGK